MLNKFISLVVMLLTVTSTQGQNALSGKIEYSLTWNLNEYYMSEEAKDETQRLMEDSLVKKYGLNSSKIFTSTFLLIFDKSEVEIMRSKEAVNTPQFYQNLISKTSISIGVTASQKYLVLDTMVAIPWKLSKNTKKIQNIECYSAQAEYRGRVWTAWYAPSIPISSGPWKLYGLPGMILEAEDRTGVVKFECSTIIIPKPRDLSVNRQNLLDTKNKIVSYKDYAKLSKESTENYEKMNKSKDGGMTRGTSDIEIFDFEKILGMKRRQQKLSDIPKK